MTTPKTCPHCGKALPRTWTVSWADNQRGTTFEADCLEEAKAKAAGLVRRDSDNGPRIEFAYVTDGCGENANINVRIGELRLY
jgi:hypothetical protein